MSHADRLDTDIMSFLERHQRKQLVRFVAVGSVDDGKSTLIGRLLHDSEGVYEDQLADAVTTSGPDGEVEIDFARLTDGLRAEREQGITIDVAYRYFTTANRKFIIADTPGHIQYTRNMATGASTADVGVILIDARLGVLQQSRRHAYIASLLGIPRLLVAVNKMDLVDYDHATYDTICQAFGAFARQLGFVEVAFIPVSALKGVNVVSRGEQTPWYGGPTCLEYLEAVDVGSNIPMDRLRFPVQYVIRPNLDYRGFAGQIVSGQVEVGDEVLALPSGKRSRVSAIDVWQGEIPWAHAPQCVTLRLEDEIDISRGDMIVRTTDQPTVGRAFEAMVVWMDQTPLDTGKSYLIKHTTRYVRVNIQRVLARINMETLEGEASETLNLNDIGRVALTAHRPIYFDAYEDNRATGAFIIIDTLTNNTVGAGMIGAALNEGAQGEEGSATSRSGVSSTERAARLGQRGACLWLSADEGRDAAALAFALERRLFDGGWFAHVLQDDEAGSGTLLAEAGLVAIVVASASGVEGPESSASTLRLHVGDDPSCADDVWVVSEPDDERAVTAICERLLSEGILRSGS